MPGESLSSVAAADGLSVAQLAAANGLPLDAQLIVGASLVIPPQGGSVTPVSSTGPAGDGDADGDEPSATPAPSAGSYVVQPGDTLSAIAARAGMTVSALAALNGIDPAGVLLAGRALSLGQPGTVPPAPTQPPAVGATVTGRMTWFGGPNDPNARGVPASGLGWRSDGMAYFNTGSLRGRWLIRFPWGQTLPMTQIDLGPAPWTGNPFDIAYSALPSTPYSSQTWPNPTVTGTYEGP